jgi:hypothetical protein
MLGGQMGNRNAYPDTVERAWPGFKAMNLNTVEYPVYWNVIEPEEGRFDFSGFDRIHTGPAFPGTPRDLAMVRHLEEWCHGLGAPLMLASNGEITPPCGVPASVSLTVPSSITPASSHCRIDFKTLRSEIRSFTRSINVFRSIPSK